MQSQRANSAVDRMAACMAWRRSLAYARRLMVSATTSAPPRVLVADDDADMRAAVIAALRDDGCSTLEAADGEALLELLRQALDDPDRRPDVLVVDIKMPRLSGIGVLEVLKRAHSKVPVVMVTGLSDEFVQTIARRLGAADVLRKPFAPGELVAAVRKARTVGDLRR